VHPWPGVDVLVGNSAFLPFRTGAFDTVTILAALNHHPNRREVLREVRRVLTDEGRCVLTMVGPLTGAVAHLLFGRGERARGGLRKGEKLGMRRPEVESLLRASGFAICRTVLFELGLNRVTVAAKA